MNFQIYFPSSGFIIIYMCVCVHMSYIEINFIVNIFIANRILYYIGNKMKRICRT